METDSPITEISQAIGYNSPVYFSVAFKKYTDMKINIEVFRDKVHACWIGKNIGGTMGGGPYEGSRQMLDIAGFSTPENTVLPNDDLDLQLVWLEAVKRVGVKNINAAVLGEFWLSYIGPYWNEYGRCKTNMKMGIVPPLSGDAFNDWKKHIGDDIATVAISTGVLYGYPTTCTELTETIMRIQ